MVLAENCWDEKRQFHPNLDESALDHEVGPFHEAFAFSPHTINLEFDEETMKPENHCGAKKQE